MPCAEGPTDCTNAHDPEAWVEVGTGDPELAGFEPIPADSRMDLFPGPQQGYHVYVQARSTGLCANSVLFERKLREPGETAVLRSQSSRIRMVEVEGEPGTWVFPRAQATFVCPATSPGIEMAGRPFDLEVVLTDSPGCNETFEPRSVSTHVTIVPTCSETDLLCAEDTEAGCAAH